MKSFLFYCLVILFVGILACSTKTTHTSYTYYEVHNGVQFIPVGNLYQVYKFMYERMLACVEKPRNRNPSFYNIRWFIADSIVSVYPNGTKKNNVAGLWRYPNNIFLVRERVYNTNTVAHEILHYLQYPITHGEPGFVECDPRRTPPN